MFKLSPQGPHLFGSAQTNVRQDAFIDVYSTGMGQDNLICLVDLLCHNPVLLPDQSQFPGLLILAVQV